MRHRRLRPEHVFEGINATPLIDVVMCLIIFFLIVGKLTSDRGQQVKLPDSRHGESAKAADPMVIDVVKFEGGETGGGGGGGAAWLAGLGRAFIIDREVPDALSLENIVRDRILDRPATAIEIRADRELPFGAVEPVLRACGKAGARSVRLATEKKS